MIYSDIDKILNWYFTESSKCLTIATFLSARDKLSVLSYRLAEECADNHLEANKAEGTLKVRAAKKTDEGLNEKMAFNKAQLKSVIDNEAIILEEKEKESISKKSQLLLGQVNKVLDAMNQRISHLSRERQTSNKQGNDA
jgi:hypothetical protein